MGELLETPRGELLIYQTEDGSVQTEVRMEGDTLWLSLKQIADLFERDKSTTSRHIKNIYREGELEEPATVAKYATVQIEGNRQISREIEYYNLDMILSVGYRVNSKRGTQFRIWANRILKEHLVQGYTINKRRLQDKQNQIDQLKKAIALTERTLLQQVESVQQARDIGEVRNSYAVGLDILDDYDHERLEVKGKTDTQADGKELYPSIEHKAAMLLYLVVKNHSFIDGNKRIAAALFLYFLEKNELLLDETGRRRISDEGIAVLTLLIAISKPDEKDIMVHIVITVLNRSGT